MGCSANGDVEALSAQMVRSKLVSTPGHGLVELLPHAMHHLRDHGSTRIFRTLRVWSVLSLLATLAACSSGVIEAASVPDAGGLGGGAITTPTGGRGAGGSSSTGGRGGTVASTGGATAGGRPGTGGANPGTGGANPGTGGANPGTGGVIPATGGRGGAQPGTGGRITPTGGANPGTGGVSPGTGGANPATGGASPGTGGATGGNATGGNATGGSATGGNGATGGSAGSVTLRSPPIVEYLINEATSGTGTGVVHDSRPTPVDLTIKAVGSTPQYASDSSGRSLSFPVGDVMNAGAYSATLDQGNRLRDAIHGSTTGTLEVVANVDWSNNKAYIFQIFGIMQEDGENDDFSLWRWDDRLEFDFTSAGGYPAGYYKRSVSINSVTPGVHIFHVVVDTTQAAPADRMRLYIDGQRPPNVAPNEGGHDIPLNEVITVPRPNESKGSTGAMHYQVVSLGGIVNYFAGTGGFRGRIYYAAIHKNALNDAEIKGAAARLGPAD